LGVGVGLISFSGGRLGARGDDLGLSSALVDSLAFGTSNLIGFSNSTGELALVSSFIEHSTFE